MYNFLMLLSSRSRYIFCGSTSWFFWSGSGSGSWVFLSRLWLQKAKNTRLFCLLSYCLVHSSKCFLFVRVTAHILITILMPSTLLCRAGEPESELVGAGFFLAPWSRSRLEKKSGAGAAKNYPAPQPCWKIKSIRKLYVSYSFFFR